jgi:Domain of unknown function (DUF6089)
MKRLSYLAILLLPTGVIAQKLHLNLNAGVTNYQGELQGKSFSLLDQSKFAFGIGATYNFTSHISVRSGLLFGKITADDKNNKDVLLKARNLNFTSNITEFSVAGEYRLFDLDEKSFTPYAFAGIALFHFNPYTKDSTGVKYYLRDLGTEGQGLAAYPDRKKYNRTQISIPFGGGIKLRVSDKVLLGYEIGLRKTFTDHLDDVSNTYPDGALLAAGNGAKAFELSYRGGEVKDGSTVYPSNGTRGKPKTKDWYYYSGFTLSFALGKSNTSSRFNRRSKIGCPGNVL